MRKLQNIPIISFNLTKYGRIATYYYKSDKLSKTIYISSLRIRTYLRKCGHGKKLLFKTINKLKRQNYKKIILKVKNNSWTEKWYFTFGFKKYSIESEYSWLILEINK